MGTARASFVRMGATPQHRVVLWHLTETMFPTTEKERDLRRMAAIFPTRDQWSCVLMATTILAEVAGYFLMAVISVHSKQAVDVRFFLDRRIAFIRQFYVTASSSYVERKRKIEAKEEPFIPPYSEDGEPPFLEEWIEADESLQVLGRSCISMLATTLHLYFKTWERQIGIAVDKSLKTDFGNGWFNGYKAYFARHVGIRFEDGPISIAMLEELVLSRNRIQHPESITTHSSHYSDDDLRKIPHPFFLDERERSLLAEAEDGQNSWLMPPTISVSSEKLFAALAEVERFAIWLEQVESEPHVR